MSYDINKWVMGDMSRKRFRRQRWLPYAIGGTMAISALLGVLEGFSTGEEEGELASIFPLMMPLFLAVAVSPFARDAWMGPRLALFDEFEQAAITRATSRAFHVMMSVLLALFAWFWAASTWGWRMPHTPLDWSTLGFALLGIGAALPIFFAEIMVPMPPESEDEGDEESAA